LGVEFNAIGGETVRLISFFEDYHVMDDAARHYIESLSRATL
jgi:hypothetical protein